MRILHVLSSARAEGTPKLVMDWLSVKEHPQAVLFLSESGELLSNFKEKTSVYANQSFSPSLKSAFKIAALVKDVCTKEKPDMVIAWPTGHSQWIHLGATRAGVKHKITHIGNPPGTSFFGKYVATAITFWLSYCLRVKFIACSAYVKSAFAKLFIVPKQNLYAVYNATDLNLFLSDLSIQKKESIMVATLEKHKDHATLINAAEQYPKLVGVVNCFGNGSLKSRLQQLISDKKVAINLCGSSNEIPLELRKHKVFVLSTTEQEGFGTVLIEAMASGCKIVASNVSATREVLQNGQWGTLVEPNNPEALAMAIDKALNSEPLSLMEIGERQAYLSQFSVEKMLNNYIAIANG